MSSSQNVHAFLTIVLLHLVYLFQMVLKLIPELHFGLLTKLFIQMVRQLLLIVALALPLHRGKTVQLNKILNKLKTKNQK